MTDSFKTVDHLDCLKPTSIVDSGHPDVVAFAESHAIGATSLSKAVSLYYAVRDKIRYDAYDLDLTVQGLSASRAIEKKGGWCVSKAVLLAACCRALSIPAALGYADVKNHLSTERLRQAMGTDVFYWHGYTAIWLKDTWVKATPAFNVELCEKFRIRPLEFDGEHDSIYHSLDMDGRRHMEYLKYKGEYSDVPIVRIVQDFKELYPNFRDLKDKNFDEEVDDEVYV
jgi:transglutaminase-like putative cysteine protease